MYFITNVMDLTSRVANSSRTQAKYTYLKNTVCLYPKIDNLILLIRKIRILATLSKESACNGVFTHIENCLRLYASWARKIILKVSIL